MNETSNSKSRVIISSIISKLELILGGFFALLCLIGSIALLSDSENSGAVFFCVLFLLSVLLLYRGIKRGKLIKLFKNYAIRLSSDPMRSIDLLAENTGTSVDVVRNNLQLMILKGYFKNTYIDLDQNCIVFTNDRATKTAPAVDSSITDSSIKLITVTCKGCGASNKIQRGSVGECEFCGSHIAGH